jgi:glycosyltransferase involved in cell wall biosynthesis
VKHVLHLCDTYGPGGAETVCSDIARGLDPARFRSSAVTLGEGWLSETLRGDGIPVTVVPTTRSADLPFLARLVRHVRRHRVDLIQTHLLATSMYGALAGRLCGVPVVSTFHGRVDVSAADRLVGLKFRLIGLGASAVVFVSDDLRAHFERASLARGDRAARVHNGVDTRRFRPAPHGDLRAELGLPPDTFLVGAVGNVRTAKAYDVLLRAAAILRAEAPRVRIVVAGEGYGVGPLGVEIARLHRELGLEDTVRFLGFRGDVPRLMNGLDAFVLTSRSEGFSIATVEAMACGLPVVATRCGGPLEIVEPDVTGLLVDVDAPAEIAAALRRLAEEDALAARLAERARRAAESRFSIGTMVAAYTRLYERSLGLAVAGERVGGRPAFA